MHHEQRVADRGTPRRRTRRRRAGRAMPCPVRNVQPSTETGRLQIGLGSRLRANSARTEDWPGDSRCLVEHGERRSRRLDAATASAPRHHSVQLGRWRSQARPEEAVAHRDYVAPTHESGAIDPCPGGVVIANPSIKVMWSSGSSNRRPRTPAARSRFPSRSVAIAQAWASTSRPNPLGTTIDHQCAAVRSQATAVRSTACSAPAVSRRWVSEWLPGPARRPCGRGPLRIVHADADASACPVLM